MANSITLSTSLVSDIQAKIDAGTATAEEVVLYTKGLNQLQTGNDFQSVVIGLSQSAVDAIDSSNAQFQEDSQDALDIFANTAGRIDSSSADAVTSINNAKDTLNQTSTNIESTLDNLTTSLPTISVISKETDYLLDNRKLTTFKGNMGSIERKHPFDYPAMMVKENTYTNVEAVFTLVNHWGEAIDSIKLTNLEGNSYNDSSHRFNYAELYHYRDYHHGDYYFNNDQPGTSTNYERWAMTGFQDNYQNSYCRFYEVERRGLHPRHWSVGSNDTNWDIGKQTLPIYNDPGHREWIMRRTDGRYLQLASARYPYLTFSRRRDYYEGDSPTYNYGYQSDDMIAHKMYSEITIDTGWGTGYQFGCYNKKLDKLILVRSEWAETGTGAYRLTPYQFSFANDFNLEEVAKGTQELATYREDVIGTGKLVEDFHKSTNIHDDVGDGTGWKKYGYENNVGTGNQNEDRYRGHVVLCDNNDLITIQFIPTKGLQLIRHTYTTNDWEYSKHCNLQSHATSYGRSQSWATGIKYMMSNDGRYAIFYSQHYSYASGMMMFAVRVSDGKFLHYRNTDTSRGYYLVPFRHNSFIWGRNRDSNNQVYTVDLDKIFAAVDETPSSANNPSNTLSWGSSEEMYFSPTMGGSYNARSFAFVHGYHHNRDLVTYYNQDGSFKSNLFDKYGNALT